MYSRHTAKPTYILHKKKYVWRQKKLQYIHETKTMSQNKIRNYKFDETHYKKLSSKSANDLSKSGQGLKNCKTRKIPMKTIDNNVCRICEINIMHKVL